MGHTVMVLCAGSGSRMRQIENKVLSLLEGKPVFIHSLEKLMSVLSPSHVVLVCREEEEAIIRGHVDAYVDKGDSFIYVRGGDTRQISVWNGLKAIPPSCGTVHIHDGARPLIDLDTLLRVKDYSKIHEAICVGMPVKDTMKIVSSNGIVIETPDRSRYWLIQTPQSFKFELIVRAYEAASLSGFSATDDASLVERLGVPVHMVEGSYQNIKITTPEDMDLASLILKRR